MTSLVRIVSRHSRHETIMVLRQKRYRAVSRGVKILTSLVRIVSRHCRHEGRSGLEERINGNRVLQELAAVAFARTAEAYDPDWTAVPERAGAALAAVEKTSQGIKLKFYDKMKALELLGKHFGLFDGTGDRNDDMKQGILEAFLKEEGDDVSVFECPAEAGNELVEPGQVSAL